MTSPHTCSIIIPTFNNEQVLPATLAALEQQVVPPPWQCEYLISDDGSTDATLAHAQEAARLSQRSVSILTHAHHGVAHARNEALTRATGSIIFFLGADILLRPGALAAHLAFHIKHPTSLAAALGFVVWDPRLTPTPLMEWMIHGGPQNNYDAVLGERTIDPCHYWYGSHLSLKRTLLAHERFTEVFNQYGWEDLELGRRLAQRGLTLTPLPAARALHRHRYTSDDIMHRQRLTGQSLITYQAQHPDTPLMPRRSSGQRLKHRLARWLRLDMPTALALRLVSHRLSFPRLFRLATAIPFWIGVEDSLASTHRSAK